MVLQDNSDLMSLKNSDISPILAHLAKMALMTLEGPNSFLPLKNVTNTCKRM